MREIPAELIRKTVYDLALFACVYLPPDTRECLLSAYNSEQSELGKEALSQIIKNTEIAEERKIPICQDTGMAIVFLEIGQDTHINESLADAVNDGVRDAYRDGFFRMSVLDPITRLNTSDNTPAVIHTEIVPGDRIKITFVPKGFGSENMSALSMLSPSDGLEGVRDFVVHTVATAGSRPCPPIVLGVGIGGTMEYCAFLAKKALLRDCGQRNPRPDIAGLEGELLERINDLDIGPQGFGGNYTALAVHIEVFPTHIAGLPIAVNVQCHANRHASALI